MVSQCCCYKPSGLISESELSLYSLPQRCSQWLLDTKVAPFCDPVSDINEQEGAARLRNVSGLGSSELRTSLFFVGCELATFSTYWAGLKPRGGFMISDFRYTIIVAKRINSNNIITISMENVKNINSVRIIVHFTYCVFCLFCWQMIYTQYKRRNVERESVTRTVQKTKQKMINPLLTLKDEGKGNDPQGLKSVLDYLHN